MPLHSVVRGLRRAELVTARITAAAEFYEALLAWHALPSARGVECWVGSRQCASIRPPRRGETEGWRPVLAGAAHSGVLTGPDETTAEVVTARARHGPSMPEPRDGEPCWLELFTSSAARADEFWAEILKWAVSGPEPIAVYSARGCPIADRMTGYRADGRRGWLSYFAVHDLTAAGSRVTELGGDIVARRQHRLLDDVLVVADPGGAVTGLAEGSGRWGA